MSRLCRLKTASHGDDGKWAYEEIVKLRSELAALKAENESLKRDAERYRMLRRGQRWSVVNGIGDYIRADELDAAIDAAMIAGDKNVLD